MKGLSQAHPSTGWLVRLRHALPILCCLVLWSTLALANAFSPQDSGWEGCSILTNILSTQVGTANVVVTQNLVWSDLQPEDGLIVLHPTRPLNPEELFSFLRAGGRVAVLDDYGAGDETLSRFHIRRIPPPKSPVRALRNNPALAIAEPVADTSGGQAASVHPTVASVKELVTNHPTGFSHPNLSPILRIAARGEPEVVIAVAGQVGRGRLLAIGDPSIVINQMMRYPGNREFAAGLARYLVDHDSWGNRGGRLYVVANGFREDGAFGNQSSLAKSVGATLRDLAMMLSETREKGFPPTLVLVFGALAALGTVAWLGAVGARAYRRIPPRFARPVPLVAQGGVAGRAAVLAAPTTHRALALLELKAALEEALASRLGLEVPVSASDLYDGAQKTGALDDSRLKALKKLLLMMGMVETSVAAGRPIRIREREVKSAASIVHDLLEAVERNGRAASQEDRS